MIRNYIIRVSFKKILPNMNIGLKMNLRCLKAVGFDNTIQKLVELNREVDSE